MTKYKIDNLKDQTILVRMDRKLKNQLIRQARGENVAIAVIARKAIHQFLDEEKKLKQLKK